LSRSQRSSKDKKLTSSKTKFDINASKTKLGNPEQE